MDDEPVVGVEVSPEVDDNEDTLATPGGGPSGGGPEGGGPPGPPSGPPLSVESDDEEEVDPAELSRLNNAIRALEIEIPLLSVGEDDADAELEPHEEPDDEVCALLLLGAFVDCCCIS